LYNQDGVEITHMWKREKHV